LKVILTNVGKKRGRFEKAAKVVLLI